MLEKGKEKLVRQYAAGEITWDSLRERGFENYVEVLAGFGELGLHPPCRSHGGTERRGASAWARAYS
jgi:hypothetical protein